ncbi:hypothetical protein TCAL_10105 [Tigriopus californicus]|uniref:Bicaudal D-related protein 1 n=1 Tax=Tigriopus californicus TaxID=6832 RepID=A0A553NYH6_TIGCA|nr:hypothetical protein TCAL_10105 [Tigriopus californicus]|eukprot:TCALIF_10105-PA protein Name:"Similar to CG17365 Bicaudal D-related protein homolog (Drosophila melanogaster)" AED:0.00 eAED:0.00 QI:36/1/1/1/0.83/0.85/7/737/661
MCCKKKSELSLEISPSPSLFQQLEQDRYRLKLQIEVMEEEYEQRISDLQTDLNKIRAALQEAEHHHRTTERERSGLIGQLTEQNQRLTSELKEAGKREEELQKRLQELRSQVNDKRVTMQDHVNHLETLKDEINLVTQRKQNLEERISELVGERSILSGDLDETSERVLSLERQNREQDNQLRNNHRVMTELESKNQNLSERLESLSRSYSSTTSSHMSSGSGGQTSLLNELENSENFLPYGTGSGGRRRCSQIDEEEFEEDFDDSEMTCIDERGHHLVDDIHHGHAGVGGGGRGVDDEDGDSDDSRMKELRDEVLTVYHQIRHLCSDIRESRLCQHHRGTTTSEPPSSRSLQNSSQRKSQPLHGQKRRRDSSDSMLTTSEGSGGSSASSTCSDDLGGTKVQVFTVKNGLLTEALADLQDLIHGCLSSDAPNKHALSRHGAHDSGRESAIDDDTHLEMEIHSTNEAYDKMLVQMKTTTGNLKRKDEEINELQSKLSMTEVQLKNACEERDNFKRDLEHVASDGGLSKDQLIRKAWEVRDAAVKRKNAAEVELAKERIGVMQVNSQLLEAIQQKVELSQQLDDWKTDMELLLEGQIRDRLIDSERRSKNVFTTSNSSAPSLWNGSSSSSSTTTANNGNLAGSASGSTNASVSSRFFGLFQRH